MAVRGEDASGSDTSVERRDAKDSICARGQATRGALRPCALYLLRLPYKLSHQSHPDLARSLALPPIVQLAIVTRPLAS